MNPEINEQPLEITDAVVDAQPEPPPPPQKMAPVSAKERIETIDILRGMALFGILAANMRGFAAPMQVYFNINRMFHDNIDWIGQAFVDAVFQGKFVTLFSFLFGLGFAIQMTRAKERGTSVWFYPRRLFFLMLIGFVHAWLIWPGDILIDYALAGFVLLLFRNVKMKTAGIWSACLLSMILVAMTGFYIATFFGVRPPMGTPDNPAEFQRTLQHAVSVYRDGSYFSRVQMNFSDWMHNHRFPGPIFLTLFVLGRFLAGLFVWRSGILKDPKPFLPIVRKVCLWGFIIGLTMDAVAIYVRFIIDPRPGTFSGPVYIMSMAHEISVLAIAAFYASGVLLLVQSEKWKQRLSSFAAVGRTALSNYLMESLVCTWFYHLTKAYGHVGPALALVPTVILFAIQIRLSMWWLQRYQFGPAEWVWRSLTYGKLQPMRRQTDATGPVEAATAIA